MWFGVWLVWCVVCGVVCCCSVWRGAVVCGVWCGVYDVVSGVISGVACVVVCCVV